MRDVLYALRPRMKLVLVLALKDSGYAISFERRLVLSQLMGFEIDPTWVLGVRGQSFIGYMASLQLDPKGSLIMDCC